MGRLGGLRGLGRLVGAIVGRVGVRAAQAIEGRVGRMRGAGVDCGVIRRSGGRAEPGRPYLYIIGIGRWTQSVDGGSGWDDAPYECARGVSRPEGLLRRMPRGDSTH